jgi:hypothetical protein
MNNNDERDYAEEESNRQFMEQQTREEYLADLADAIKQDHIDNPELYGQTQEPESEPSGDFWNNLSMKEPASSGYDWLLTEPLWAMSLGRTAAVLVWDDSSTYSAILDTEDGTGILTVNNQIINWHSHYLDLMNIIEIVHSGLRASNTCYPFNPIIPEDDSWVTELENGIINPLLAPGQTENNVVNTLECGHEVDTEEELATGTEVYCSVHGLQKVTS